MKGEGLRIQVRAGGGAGFAHQASIFLRGAHLDPDEGEGLVRESRAQPGGGGGGSTGGKGTRHTTSWGTSF